MHKLEITGATPEDLFMNAVRMLSVLLKGGATTMAPDLAQNGAPSAVEPPSPAGGAAESEPATTAAKTRKRKIDAVVKLSNELSDEIPDIGAKTGEVSGPKELTLDGDIRPRLREIQKACTARKMDMPATVAYIMKLYGPFGVQKADQLKPEQFEEFMEASEAYLKGDV